MTPMRYLALLLISCGMVINACKKDDKGPKDSRDQYIGKYQTTESINCYGPCGTCSYQKDTVITVSYGLTDSTLNVLGRDVHLDSAGWYFSYHYGLHLWNDSVYSNYMNGGLGCGQYEVYEGYRISHEP